jgi:hypothetical protein
MFHADVSIAIDNGNDGNVEEEARKEASDPCEPRPPPAGFVDDQHADSCLGKLVPA